MVAGICYVFFVGRCSLCVAVVVGGSAVIAVGCCMLRVVGWSLFAVSCMVFVVCCVLCVG